MYSRMLLTFTLLISLLVTGLSSFLYYSYTQSSVGIINSMNNKLLSQISYSTTYMTDIAVNFTNSVYFNNAIAPLLYAETEDLFVITGAIRNLDAQVIRNSYIHSVYTFNRKLDRFISTETNSFYTQDNFYDSEIVRLINEAKDNKARLVPLPRVIPLKESANGSKTINVYSFVMFPPPSGDNAPVDSAIVVNMKADWLRDTIAGLKSKSDSRGDIIVIDASGRIVSDSSTDTFLTQAEENPVLKRIRHAAQANDSFVERINGKQTIVSYDRLEDLGWQFVSLTPYESVIAPVRRAQWTTVAVCLVILIAGLWLSRVASRAIYSPMGAFLSQVRQQGSKPEQDAGEIGDVSFLSGVFAHLHKQKDHLERLAKDQRRPLKDKFLRDLLSGNVYDQTTRLAETMRSLHIDLQPDRSAYLVLLKLDGYKSFSEQYKEQDQALLRFGIANIAGEVAMEWWRHEVVVMDNDHLCLVFNALDDEEAFIEDRDSTDPLVLSGNAADGANSDDRYAEDAGNAEAERIGETVKRIQEAVRRYLQLSLSAVWDESPCRLLQLDDRYEKLLHLSMNRVIFGHGSRFTPHDVMALDGGQLKIPAAKEKQLLDAIKLGNLDKAGRAYKDISAMMRTTTYDHMLAYMIYLLHTMYNSVQTAAVNEGIPFSAMFSAFFKNVSYFETADEIDDMFINLIADVINKLDKSKMNRNDELIGHIKQMIVQQYADKSLCLNLIAERFGMSSVYLGKLFKDATGRSIAEHITDVRMEKLKILLEANRLATKEMLDQVGLEENSYFYTLFKKYFGVPLSEYRYRLRLNTTERSGDQP